MEKNNNINLDINKEKESIKDFLNFIKEKYILLIEETHSQENLIYKEFSLDHMENMVRMGVSKAGLITNIKSTKVQVS